MPKPEGPICQSCSMPLEKPEHFGTEADGSKSREFCTYCYQNGKYTDPTMTMEKMIGVVAGYMVSGMKTPEAEAKQFAGAVMPTLKRWRK